MRPGAEKGFGRWMRGAVDRITGTPVERRLRRVERLAEAGRATYLGNGRVIVGMTVRGEELLYFLDADDRLITPWVVIHGNYEVELTAYLARTLRPDANTIDVGANFGYFTCLAGKLCPDGHAVGIEAEAGSVAIARDNVAVNGLFDRAEVLHAAANADGSPLDLYRRVGRAGNTSITRMGQDFTDRLGEAPEEPFTVPGVRVDDVAARWGGRVDFLKVDVEGAEPLVIAGARETIAANPGITLSLEWSPGQIGSAGFDPAQLVAELAQAGLHPFDLMRGQPLPLTAAALLAIPYRAAILFRRRD